VPIGRSAADAGCAANAGSRHHPNAGGDSRVLAGRPSAAAARPRPAGLSLKSPVCFFSEPSPQCEDRPGKQPGSARALGPGSCTCTLFGDSRDPRSFSHGRARGRRSPIPGTRGPRRTGSGPSPDVCHGNIAPYAEASPKPDGRFPAAALAPALRRSRRSATSAPMNRQ
jgi:hypothetical protein